jgi:hypothetical protein
MSVSAPNPDVSSKVELVRVTEIMHEIREQISPTTVRRARCVRDLERSGVLLPELRRLETLVESVRHGATQIGSMPPVPQTLRGRIGAVMVALVQRSLFWLMPQFHAFHLKVAAALDEQASATQAILDDLQEVHVQLAELKRLAAQEDRSEASPPKEQHWPKSRGYSC